MRADKYTKISCKVSESKIRPMQSPAQDTAKIINGDCVTSEAHAETNRTNISAEQNRMAMAPANMAKYVSSRVHGCVHGENSNETLAGKFCGNGQENSLARISMTETANTDAGSEYASTRGPSRL
jgi:hypothetical protein